MEAVSIREAGDGDVRGIAEIHVRSWRAAYRDILPRTLLDGLSVTEREGSWGPIVRDGGEAWLTLVAECDGQLVGFCSVATPSQDRLAGERTVEVGALYVDPDSWRKGAGRAMMAVALKALRKQGWREVMLWALPENLAALDFYRGLGLEVQPGVEKREERSGNRVIQLRMGL